MNTPAHAIINLLVLSRNPDHARTTAILGGALLPDLVIIGFYAWQLAIGTPENQIWSIEYYRPLWQGWIDSFNSIPLILLGMLLSWHTRHYFLMALFSSMLLHVGGDLPLHHDDAHRHFFPFFDWRFASPVSYWDPQHHGLWASLVELIVTLSASAYMIWRQPLLRPWIIVLVGIYLIYLGYVIVVWA